MNKNKWSDEKILEELSKIIYKINDFPTTQYLKQENYKLLKAIGYYGGINKFREMMGYGYILSPKGYWTNEKIVHELNLIISKTSKFPDVKYLISINRWDLLDGIKKNGGLYKYYKLLGYQPYRKQEGYWTKDKCIEEIKRIMLKIDKFPTTKQIKKYGASGVVDAIHKKGGINIFRKILGYKPVNLKGYWNKDKTISEIKNIISKTHKFPTSSYLFKTKRADLQHAITKNGGYRLFRSILGINIPHKLKGYWTEDNILKELQKVIEQIGHFPTQSELIFLCRNDLLAGISCNGGLIHFMQICGYDVSYLHKLLSQRACYCNKRGKKSEDIVYEILLEYCKIKNISLPIKNKKLSKNHRIEFVCNTNKKIGIDVTNTKTKKCVIRKWTKKEYHKYLDELWIVVFSDIFTKKDYEKWNQESPDNVYIYSVDDFIDELQYDIDTNMKNTIEKYKKCTFHSRL